MVVLYTGDLITIAHAATKFWWLNWKSLMMTGLFQRITGSSKESIAMGQHGSDASQLFSLFYLGNGKLSFSFFLFRFYIRIFEKIKKRAKSNLAIITIGISFSHRLSQPSTQ